MKSELPLDVVQFNSFLTKFIQTNLTMVNNPSNQPQGTTRRRCVLGTINRTYTLKGWGGRIWDIFLMFEAVGIDYLSPGSTQLESAIDPAGVRVQPSWSQGSTQLESWINPAGVLDQPSLSALSTQLECGIDPVSRNMFQKAQHTGQVASVVTAILRIDRPYILEIPSSRAWLA